MTTIANLVDQIDRDLLVHYARPLYDVPASSYSDSVATITLANTETLAAGSILDAGFELMYVTDWNSSTKVATVIRGFLGTTKAGGDSSTLIRINPRFPTPTIVSTITDELRSWDERVFRTEADSLTFTASATSVEATPTTTPYRVLYARPRPYTSDDVRKYVKAELRRGEPSGQFTSGYSIHLDEPFGASTTVDVLYACAFDFSTITTSTNLEGDLDLTTGMLEILKWGSMARIVAGKEAARLDPTVFRRPDLDQAVPATALLQASAQYMRLRDLAYDREYRRLVAQWLPRRDV